MQVCREAVALAQGGLELNGRIATRAHFLREIVRLAVHLPAQLPGPKQSPAEHQRPDRNHAPQSRRRPPRGRAHHRHVRRVSQHDVELHRAQKRPRPFDHGVFELHDTSHLQLAVRLHGIQRRRVALVKDGSEDHAALFQRESAPGQLSVRRGLHSEQLRTKADEMSVEIVRLRGLPVVHSGAIQRHDFLGGDHHRRGQIAHTDLAHVRSAEPADAPRHIDEARRLHPIPCAEGDVRPRLHPHCASVFLQIEKLARQRKRHGALDAQPLRFFRLRVEGTQSIQRQEWRAEGGRRGGFFHHEIPRNAHQDSRIQKFAARIEA